MSRTKTVRERVRRLLLMGSSERSVSAFLDEYERNDAYFIATLGEPEPIGAIAFTFMGGVLDVRDIAVVASLRRQGVGSRLIREAIRRHSPRRVIAETDDDAVAFYRKLGFSSEPFESEWGATRYRMELVCERRTGAPDR